MGEGNGNKIFLKQKKSVGIPSRNLDINVGRKKNDKNGGVERSDVFFLFFKLKGLCNLAESDVASAINAEKSEQVAFVRLRRGQNGMSKILKGIIHTTD